MIHETIQNGRVRTCDSCGGYREMCSIGGSVMRVWTVCNWLKVQIREYKVEGRGCWHPKGVIPVIDEEEVEG